jgi:hypothetical protein
MLLSETKERPHYENFAQIIGGFASVEGQPSQVYYCPVTSKGQSIFCIMRSVVTPGVRVDGDLSLTPHQTDQRLALKFWVPKGSKRKHIFDFVNNFKANLGGHVRVDNVQFTMMDKIHWKGDVRHQGELSESSNMLIVKEGSGTEIRTYQLSKKNGTFAKAARFVGEKTKTSFVCELQPQMVYFHPKEPGFGIMYKSCSECHKKVDQQSLK